MKILDTERKFFKNELRVLISEYEEDLNISDMVLRLKFWVEDYEAYKKELLNTSSIPYENNLSPLKKSTDVFIEKIKGSEDLDAVLVEAKQIIANFNTFQGIKND